jgi:hypothetical protein
MKNVVRELGQTERKKKQKTENHAFSTLTLDCTVCMMIFLYDR